MGYFLTVFAYVKAHLFPCHPDDRKFSGSLWYDMFMGVEFNPRLGEMWDFKVGSGCSLESGRNVNQTATGSYFTMEDPASSHGH